MINIKKKIKIMKKNNKLFEYGILHVLYIYL